jgi:hypothetical protein
MSNEYEDVTKVEHVQMYEASHEMFHGLLTEIRKLSSKKPEGTMSVGKVKIVNRVLGDLLTFLKKEPEGKYLDELDDESLPQFSDAVLVMVQFEKALKKFYTRYHDFVAVLDRREWITEELVAELAPRRNKR